MKHRAPPEQLDGYLFAKLLSIGTRSEGPQYFLQLWDYRELAIVKRVKPNEVDPPLQELLGRKVSVRGRQETEGLVLEQLAALGEDAPQAHRPSSGLALELQLESDRLRVHRNLASLAGCRIRQHFDLTLTVSWSGPSPWTGTSPTTKLYDFSLWREGRELWRWSTRRQFANVVTPVSIPAGGALEYSVTWHFSPEELEGDGAYLVRGTFIASGESVEQPFEVVFVG